MDDVTVTDRDGDDVRVTKQSDTRYTFTMPDSKVEVEVSFVKTGETAQEPDTMTFSDVKAETGSMMRFSMPMRTD